MAASAPPPWGLLLPQQLRQVLRLLYTHNPFYLLSVAFVLHGTRLWFRHGTGSYDPWPLMFLIGGYILLIALVAFLVVRVGRVWDDARSIFLILLLLFVELSLTFDPVLITRWKTGLALLAVGWGLSLLVSEALLLGLRIRLPLLFRVPYHLLLGLLFAWPPAIVAAYGSGTESAVWRIGHPTRKRGARDSAQPLRAESKRIELNRGPPDTPRGGLCGR